MHQTDKRLKVAGVDAIESQLVGELGGLRKSLVAESGIAPRPLATAERAIRGVERSLTRPLRIAVLGEENSGKSLFLNYLLKHQILPSNRFSGEETEILIRYSPEPSVYIVGRDGSRNRLTSRAFGVLSKAEARSRPQASNIIYQASGGGGATPQRTDRTAAFPQRRAAKTPSKLIEVSLPLDVLRRIEFVEVRALPEDNTVTPATIAFRQVDISLWCTLATQAWKESEAASWRRIPLVHRQSALMLVTYKDAVQDRNDEVKILERLRRATPTMFNDILLVSLKDAVASLLSPDPQDADELRAVSNIDKVEEALTALIREQQTRRLRKSSRILRSISNMIARADTAGADKDKQRRAIARKLDRIADAVLDVAPSASLTVEAA